MVVGARPNFMKAAPILRAIASYNAGLQPSRVEFDKSPIYAVLVHTGQHYDAQMSDSFFSDLNLPAPNVFLGVGSGSHAEQTAEIMRRFEKVMIDENPDVVLVVGDVNSTLACALVAAKMASTKERARPVIVHVEAGLRSFDRTMPEEINRVVTDALADLLFTPSPDGDDNLRREGIEDSKIRLVGNIMIDNLLNNLDKARTSNVLRNSGLKKHAFVYVTLHRPSNVDDPVNLSSIMVELAHLAKQMPVVFPMHPRTKKMCGEFGISYTQDGALKIFDPIGYHDSLCLTENARFVLTDSGGLQEESTYFRTPCLTLRPNTERPVTISAGSNRLTTTGRFASDVKYILNGPIKLGQVPPLWDGKTAERIVSVLMESANKNTMRDVRDKPALVC